MHTNTKSAADAVQFLPFTSNRFAFVNVRNVCKNTSQREKRLVARHNFVWFTSACTPPLRAFDLHVPPRKPVKIRAARRSCTGFDDADMAGPWPTVTASDHTGFWIQLTW